MLPLAHAASGAAGGIHPVTLSTLLVAGAIYAHGARTLRRLATGRRVIPGWRVGSAGLGLVVLIVALASPLHDDAQQSFALHMVQHLLVLLAAPLLAVGGLGYAAQAALSARAQAIVRRTRRTRMWRRWRSAAPAALVGATVAHIATLWLWHTPFAYDAAIRHPAVHTLEHASLLASATVFWMLLVRPAVAGRRAGGFGVLCVAAVLFQGGVLGALLAFARFPLYATHAASLGAPAAVQDQQVAGALMWVVPGFLYAVAAVVLFLRWLHAVEMHRRGTEATP